MSDEESISSEINTNPGYVLGQLAKAFATSRSNEDEEARIRAGQKVESWIKVYEGMLSGALKVGSRTPLANTPGWVTLEVAKGGFATGALLAGGALRADEKQLLERLPEVTNGTERAALNSYYLSDNGLVELKQMLESGCYRIEVPEEGALLTVAWLLQNGYGDDARAVLDEIGPYLSRLRFYPTPASKALIFRSIVCLQDVRQTVSDLQARRRHPQLLIQEEAIQVWAPLYDQVVKLFAETVEGSFPSLKITTSGKRFVEGGWPCQIYPKGWTENAKAVLADYKRLRAINNLSPKPDCKKENFCILREYLAKCVENSKQLTGRQVGKVRSILAAIAYKRGLPGSLRCQDLRRTQLKQIAGQTMQARVKEVLIERLSRLRQDEGLESSSDVFMPISQEESERFGFPPHYLVPPYLVHKVYRCLYAPLEVLVENGVIPSAEVLATVIPQITSQVRAAAIADPDLRRLYAAMYTAFCRRRSLLLFNLESQIRFNELPWVRVIEAHLKDSLNAREHCRKMLEQIFSLAITAFPQKILPNRLLQELRSLAVGAGLQLPIVDELATDIFMGAFSDKFLEAAKEAGELLKGKLYERYYGVPYVAVQQLNDVVPSYYGTPISPGFHKLCCKLAGESEVCGPWSPARNGRIIEQAQIITTHNLANLLNRLGLVTHLKPRMKELSQRCFRWICRKHQQKIDNWRSRLRMTKNTAYAWRQMIFFLSLMPKEEIDMFFSWAHDYLSKQRMEYQIRFRPALNALAVVAGASTVGRIPSQREAVSRFLGWTTGKHWLITKPNKQLSLISWWKRLFANKS